MHDSYLPHLVANTIAILRCSIVNLLLKNERVFAVRGGVEFYDSSGETDETWDTDSPAIP